ncbi:flippase [Halobacteriales archaeon QS_4_62_28]|nr:MAG: flippase [Halobacteriales archaeon QS_4_62_28]
MVKKIVRGISVVFVGQILGMLTKGALILLLTRFLLRPSEYGLLFLSISVLGFAMLFANLGFEKAGAKYVAEYRESAPELVSTAVRKTILYNCLAITAVGIGLALFHSRIATTIGEPAIAGLLLFGIGYVAAKSIKGTAVILFQGFNWMGWVAILNIITNISLVIAVPAFILLGYGIEGALSGYIISYAVGGTVGIFVMYTELYERHDISPEQEADVSSGILRYSVPLTFTMSASVINSRTDTVLLGVFQGPVAIAYYTLGKQISDFLITPARSLGFAVSPTYGEQKANENLQQAARLYEQSFIYTILLYGPAAAGVVLVANPTIELIFGAKYHGAGPVLQIFSIFVVFRALDTTTSDALDFLGRARSRAIAKGGSAVCNVVLNLLLIPRFGVIGAAVATVLTYGAYVGLELFVIADELPINTRRLLRSGLVVGAITLGMSAVVYPLSRAVSDISSLIGVIAVGGGIWALLIALTDVVDLRQLYATLT